MGTDQINAWPFTDPPNVAVFTNKKIVEGTDWIQRVSHDEDDGAWQFHPIDGTTESDARVVGLKTIFQIDPSIALLADLPAGWCASRTSANGAWKREKNLNAAR
jgi:hypothetical protein